MTWTMNWRRYFARDSSKRARTDASVWRVDIPTLQLQRQPVFISRGAYQEVIFYYGGIETLNCLATARTGTP